MAIGCTAEENVCLNCVKNFLLEACGARAPVPIASNATDCGT
jgi:hypothetical protein